MQIFKIWRYTSLIILVSIGHSSFAQNMNSPYSLYGVGDRDLRAYNRTSGMASTGLAIKSPIYNISTNPAALSALQRSFFTFDVAFKGKFVNYSGTPITADNSNNRDFSLERFSFAVKLNSFWASNIGFKKFSNVNYEFASTKQIEGSSKRYTAYYEGDGGLNDFFWSNAFSIGKHFSVGVKSSFIVGSINQVEKVSDEEGNYNIATKRQDFYRNFQFDYGFQYYTASNKKWNFSLGSKFSNKAKLSSKRYLTVIENNTTVVNDKYIESDQFYLPVSYGVGAALYNKKGATFAVDYNYEDWSSLKVRGVGWGLRSSNRLSVGAEFAKFGNYWNQQYEKKFFQVGSFINNSYLSLRNTQIKEYGVTAGMGGVLRNNLLYTLAAEVGTRGTTRNDLIRENYIQLTLTLNYRDFFNSKGRRFD